MTVLGIDTSTREASAALIQDDTIIADERWPQVGSQPNGGHAGAILPLIEIVIKKAHRSLKDLQGIAVTIGPGSFTGLRIGLSTVKGLAYGAALPVSGISTLLANAARVTLTEGLICSLLDAKKKEVYAAFFSAGSLARLSEDFVAPIESVIERAQPLLANQRCVFIGDGADVYSDCLSAALGGEFECAGDVANHSVGAAVARLGQQQLNGGGDSLAALVPLYLRRFEAEMKSLERL
jgi:tRNA threonylcarbamoyladenosine biosynthesis protein TsaB